MKSITVYSTDYCPYCVRAKNLLISLDLPFEEINLQNDPQQLKELKERTGLRTVPQIFIGEELIGGYTDLQALVDADKLNEKLKN